jgi:hypothetical protein
MTKRDEYTAKIKTQLDDLNKQMDELSAKAADAKADARETYNAEMAKLRHQSKLAVAKFEELKLAGEGTWDKMVAEMDNISDAFVHSFKYFKSQL